MKFNKKNSGNIILFSLLIILAAVLVIGIKKDSAEGLDNKDTSTQLSSVTNNKNTTNTDSNKTEKKNAAEKNNTKKTDRFEGLTLTNGDITVPVLCYHDVNPKQTNDMLMDPAKFKEQMQYLKDNKYTTLTMDELYGFLKEDKKIPEKSVVITFDDGYIGNYTYAMPILKELDLHATMFMISGMLNNELYVNEKQLKEMSDSDAFEIQSHTAMHEHLATLTEAKQLETMKTAKEKLESIIGKPVEYIAYPYGESNKNTRTAAKNAGYKLGFSLDGAMADKKDNNYNIDRLYVSNNYTMDQFIKKLTTAPRDPQ